MVETPLTQSGSISDHDGVSGLAQPLCKKEDDDVEVDMVFHDTSVSAESRPTIAIFNNDECFIDCIRLAMSRALEWLLHWPDVILGDILAVWFIPLLLFCLFSNCYHFSKSKDVDDRAGWNPKAPNIEEEEDRGDFASTAVGCFPNCALGDSHRGVEAVTENHEQQFPTNHQSLVVPADFRAGNDFREAAPSVASAITCTDLDTRSANPVGRDIKVDKEDDEMKVISDRENSSCSSVPVSRKRQAENPLSSTAKRTKETTSLGAPRWRKVIKYTATNEDNSLIQWNLSEHGIKPGKYVVTMPYERKNKDEVKVVASTVEGNVTKDSKTIKLAQSQHFYEPLYRNFKLSGQPGEKFVVCLQESESNVFQRKHPLPQIYVRLLSEEK